VAVWSFGFSRMNLTRELLLIEAENAGIPAEQAQELWSRLATATEGQQKFDSLHVAYYFGGMIIIGAMTFFFSLAWERVGGAGILALALAYGCLFGFLGPHLFHSRRLYVAGGLLTVVAVCMTPLAVYGLERALGWWPQGNPASYHNYHVWVKGSWLFMELATLAAGAVALRFVKFPFLTAPMALTLWYMSMDLTPLLFGKADFTGSQQLWVSVIFGVVMLVLAYLVDRRTRDDYAFWLYLFGLAAFWGGLSLMDSGGPWSRFVYCVINIVLIAVSALLGRRVFAVFGSFGVAGYLSYLAFRLFKDSLFLPMALTVIGVGVIMATVAYQRNRARIDAYIVSILPDGFMRLLPAERVGP
jgi:hypothetical protein